MNATYVEPGAATRDEHVGRDPATEELFAAPEVVSQDGTAGRMNWDYARSAELGTANRQDGVFEVHVTKLEVQRFADTQASNAKQADEAMEHPGPQRRRRPGHRQFQCCIQQAPYFRLRV